MKRIAMLVVSMMIVTGCQTTDYTGDEDSFHYRIPVGSTLTLNQALTIPADRSSIYLFRGKVVTYHNVDIYYPHCELILEKVSNRTRTVKPDTFIITRVNDWEDYRAQNRQYLVDASIVSDSRISGGIAIGAGGDGGPSIIKYATIISLQSNSQPDVKEILCAQWGDMGRWGVKPVTIYETRQAIGKIFTLNIKTP